MTPRAIVACLMWAWSTVALALDPALEVSQYGHTAWRIRDGFLKGIISSLAQTPDGYLWLGTEFGLVRFDGVRTVPWQPPPGTALPDNSIFALLAARDGTLWIGTWGGLASWSGGRLVTYPAFEGGFVNALAEDHEGTVWAAGRKQGAGLLCAIRGGQTECHGADRSLGTDITALREDRRHTLWVVGTDRVWRWKPAPQKAYPLPELVETWTLVGETQTGAILIGAKTGILQIANDKVERFALPGPVRAKDLLVDRDGSLWIGTRDRGLLHVGGERVDTFGGAQGLSGEAVTRLFEDREGNMWVATLEGLDRFRPLAAAHYSAAQGVPSAYSVLSARNGSVWLSTSRGVLRWTGQGFDKVTVPVRPGASLFEDRRGRVWIGSQEAFGYVENDKFVRVNGVPHGYIDSMVEDLRGNLWIAHRDAGLLRLSADQRIEQTSWKSVSIPSGGATRLTVDPSRGGLWIGSFAGGIVHFLEGRVVASYSSKDGLGKGAVRQINLTPDGTVWAATEGGLSRIKAGHFATLDSGSGLPCDKVHAMIEAADDAWWLYTACGLVRIARSELGDWTAAVDRGSAPPKVRVTVLDSVDGVRAVSTLSTFSPYIAKAHDGKLWLATYDGVTVVDPRRLHINHLAPTVLVESIVADRKAYPPSSGGRLPPLVRDLEIQYTATSLVAPEKMQFKYKLEGRDKEWNDAGNRRQAFYTDLDPGHYRFRVIASNNSGVWNEQGASLEFSVAPAYWQTWWFRALCVAALVALLYALYRWRVRQIAREFSVSLDARVAERTRIARELHDTLLQGFHGVLLKFQTVFELLPHRAAEAKQIVASTIDQAAEAITEGRDAVQGLRISATETNDLAESIRSFADELAEEGGGGKVAVRMEVIGVSRALHPIVRDEIFRIASEALRNAFRHSGAQRIEMELRYGERELRLSVRDDGRGIAPEVLSAGGREGHFGLHGMRERTRVIGGKLTVWSAQGSGTEIELIVPAANAYAPSGMERAA